MISGVPKWVQKGNFISGLGVHGAPWAPKSVFGPESCISRPPKVTPRSDNRLKKGTKAVENWPGGLREVRAKRIEYFLSGAGAKTELDENCPSEKP